MSFPPFSTTDRQSQLVAKDSRPDVHRSSSEFSLAAPISITTFALGFTFILEYWLRSKTPFYVSLAAVSLLSACYGRRVGWISLVLSVLGLILIFLLPLSPLGRYDPRDFFRLLLYIASGLLVSHIGGRLREARQSLEAVRDELLLEKETRERFIATISHDLRTPLTAAKTSAQLLQRYPDREEGKTCWITRILENIERMDRMIQTLLDVNRLRAGHRLSLQIECFDLTSLVSNTVETISIMHGNRFLIKTDGSLSGYWCRNSLSRIIENLLNNAVKFGDPALPITVRIEHKRAIERVSISVHNQGGQLIATENVFEAFAREQPRTKDGQSRGWGLGLTVVKGLTEAHGGQVEFQSTAVEGTTFTVSLPLDARSFQLDRDSRETA